MHNLSKEQEAYISSIGLGHLLNMKVDGCASIMGHYIVRNFNADRMLLYVENVRCDSVKLVRCRPAICCWNVDKLRERERVECRTIGLGTGELQDPFQVINQASGTGNVGQEKVQGNDVGGVRCKGNQGDDIFSGSGESVEQKKVLEDKINDVVKKYLDNQLVKEWKNKVNDLFTEVSASEEPEQSQWWYDNEAEIECTLILATTNKQFDNSPIAKCSIQMSQEYADFANGSGTKSFKNAPPSKMEMSIPLSVVPFNNDEHWVIRRGYRPRMKSEYLKSPYIIRAVDIIKGVPRQEKRVAKWIFSLQGEPNQVLNLDESKCAPESPLRVYCKTNVTNSYLESDLTESQRKDKFIENLVLSIEDMDASLRFVGLLFLPIICSFHIFLFVINLQQPEFVIVEHKVDDPDGERYGQLPQIIKEYIVDYLKSQNHPKAEMFSHVMPHRLEMHWRTINNIIDCGVFTMRHMETYMGGSMNEFKAGFKNESSAQDDQLVKLRTKYLYKILTHEYNVQKDYVLQKVNEFYKIPSKQRSQLLAIAKEENHRRLDDLS
ncbi:unnamed protein product [Lactuca saligna]|uniref:Ubiquitin-like protease family profile domain-containing protein n=1 Tax=Lactuca saligna TaxID=75948 RepID=A0AA36EQ56_LACSI|nr:unnamed protein product [Lactuca saligna]